MEAFFFGPSKSYLFGAFHPRHTNFQDEGVVLCNPFGQEYLRAHKSIRRLAINLAELGYPVLRFDYRGTGDSAGDLTGVTSQDWIDDIGHAIQELRDIASVSRVAVVGLRLGGLLAAKAAAENEDISRLILWDPIIDGDGYIEEIKSVIERAQHFGSRSKILEQDGTIHFNGFCMPKLFQESLARLRLNETTSDVTSPIAQFVSHESDDFASIQQHLGQRQTFHSELAPAPHDWNYVDHVGGILWPKPVIDAISRYFSTMTHQKMSHYA
ncbi:alpha/beta fold hydrolase [Marinobacter salinisoli]|uniref:Alpha/beta fold hydrolase n=1 Tax=Marinobacter salinisoli TaxID=2769486 RepID=A0ABX7MN64_9GAMM|nr:alpha/beta fold hydrolase [Marinobacter salinisoli]QSP93687.1 alpha/beta fold hydrolase [Marinobacter salinisoli]